MTFEQVWYFFRDKRDTTCPITEKLMDEGFRQKNRGYIENARNLGINNPSQWWHLMYYCVTKMEIGTKNYPYTPCGELLFWMAEVSGAISAEELQALQEEICHQKIERSEGNKKIKELCWNRIKETVERQSSL